ncbi:MAG: M14 family metallopeptidase [Phycisphaerales bacterium]
MRRIMSIHGAWRPWTTVAVVALAASSAALAQQQLPSANPIAFNRFYTHDEIGKLLEQLVATYPKLLAIETIGKSEQGRPIWVVTMNNPDTGPAADKPAMYIDGNVHGNEIQASETVIYSIDYLAKAYGKVPSLTALVDRSVFYFLPCVNPDGRQNWFDQPNTPNSSRTGYRPIDDDNDGLFDEDPPDDLDGDGSIGVMWRRDPNGTHRRDPDDPRIFVRVEPPAKGDWSFAGTEGYDNDGDGLINEDGPGQYDMNRNWPSDWQPDWVQSGAGDYPFSFPETRAIGAWIMQHPNIAAGQSYHNAGGMILRGPGASYRQNQYSPQDLAVYNEIGKAGEELLPFYRALVIYSDLYTVHGGFINWLAEGLGIVSFTNELWNDKRILQNGQTPADDKARMRWSDRALFGQTFTDWKTIQHPGLESLGGEVVVGGPNKWSARIPPPFMLEEECHRNFAFTMFHADQMPRLAWERTEVKRLSPRLWEVTVELANSGLIPTRTGRAAEKRIGMPDRLTIAAADGKEGVKVVTSGTMQRWTDQLMQPVELHPERIDLEGGVPSRGRLTFRFIVAADEGRELKLRYTAEKATDVETTVKLAEAPAKAAAAP